MQAEDISLSKRLESVRERVVRAAERVHRDPAGILLLAVTKVFPAATIQAAYALGLRDFGENYVQEFEQKATEVSHLPGARFHLIGHLQSNKSARATELFDVIQTVDSARLAQRLNDSGKRLDVYLEIKLGEEEAKTGAKPDKVPELAAAVRECANLRLLGLMTIPPWSEDAETSRPYFRRLQELAKRNALHHLSMGMSNDFEVAIEEGATCVRIGTALFGKRRKG